MNGLIKGMAAASLGWLAIGSAANAQGVAQPGQPAAAQPGQPGQPGGAVNRDNAPNGDLPGPIDSVHDIEDTGKMLFKLADTDNNGQISQKEAVDAGNLVAGGFFFRADQNGDGTLSREEVQGAREALFRQQPMLRFILQRGRAGVQQAAGNNAAAGNNNAAAGNNAAGGNPAATIGNLLDTNNDKQLQAAEVRQAIQTAVQAGFASADTNRDNQLTPSEINSALLGVGRAVARAGFQAADSDNNGQMSRDEFDKAIIEPANVVFGVFDSNSDGQISPQEMQSAAQFINGQLRGLRVPEGTPANVPNFRTPEEGGAGRPGAAGAAAPATAPQPR